jgi:CHAT domain-containing protein/tetratricopeptide (TPR) repeat protein
MNDSIPPGIEVELGELQRIDAHDQDSPGLLEYQIAIMEQIRRRTPQGQYKEFRAALLNDLGLAYQRLSPKNLQGAISCFTEALELYSAETDPLDHGSTLHNLGNAYRDLTAGDRAANVQKAIDCYTEALRFRTADAAPLDYALTQSNLGNVYRDLAAGDPTANLQKAIDCYTEALRFYTAKAAPVAYAAIQSNLGRAYDRLPAGDQTANLRRAIDCYTEALRYLTAGDNPLLYAMTQDYLSLAYRDLPTGDLTANLNKAISCSTSALRLPLAEIAPLAYASIQHNLGTAYAALPAGDQAAHLRQAIGCYTEALRFYTGTDAPRDYAVTQNDLGRAYAALPADRAANLQQAIDCYTEALRYLTAEDAPLDYAMTQNNLGNAYSDLLTGDRTAHLQRAIGCYTEALRFYTPETAPADYAMTQNNLGSTYYDLPTGDRAANLQRAIGCCTEALRFRTPDTAPLDYALTQNNLGLAYTDLPAGDRAANLQQAIGCYTEALRFRTPDTAPLDYALTQNNLGHAYSHFPIGDEAANLRQAIGCYTEALRFYTPETAPLDYAMTQGNLGAAYGRFPGRNQAANAAQAIGCYTEALRFYTPETAPLDYALTQNNLGIAYAELSGGDRAANLRQAIGCYTEALRFRTPQTAPLDYALTQNNLGNAYSRLPGGDRAANLRQAIGCYTEALRFRTAEAVPAEHRTTALNLGALHFSEGRWEQAHDCYASAISAGDLLYQASATEAGRQAELQRSGQAAADDAYCLAHLHRFTEAVERLEGARTRSLAEAMARDWASLGEARDEDREAFEQARDRINALEAAARAGQDIDSPHRSAQAVLKLYSDLALARKDLADLVKRIRAYVPAFMAEGLTLPQISEAAAENRPLVYLATTEHGSLALIVTTDAKALDPGKALWLRDLTADGLDRLLVQRDASGEVSGGYLPGQVLGDRTALSVALKGILPLLRKQLTGPLTGRLRALGASQATIIPVGQLSLLPLPAAVPDDVSIALAPSARTLHSAKSAGPDPSHLSPVLLAAGNPLPLPRDMHPLAYASQEVRAIAALFTGQRSRVLAEQEATLEHITEGLPGTTHLHLACHGSFDMSQPLDSALHLAGDDRLALRDLLDGDLRLSGVRLAVLSACQTGITEFERIPDEAVGLPAGFLLAGVPQVVATLWPVNDVSTAVLMAEFYRLLIAEHLDPAVALHRAQAYLRDGTPRQLDLAGWLERRYAASGGTDTRAVQAARYFRAHPDEDPPFADPYYWAAFTYTGA